MQISVLFRRHKNDLEQVSPRKLPSLTDLDLVVQ